MISADVGTLPASTVHMLTRRQALAISQDRLGRQGRDVYQDGNLQLVGQTARGRRPGRGGSQPGDDAGKHLLHRAGDWPEGPSVHGVRDLERRTIRARAMRFQVSGTSALLLRITPRRRS